MAIGLCLGLQWKIQRFGAEADQYHGPQIRRKTDIGGW
jgi:anthranilate/para-aminobenzoate synthase component II